MLDNKSLQRIRDAVLGVTSGQLGDLNSVVYLQQIRDAILGVANVTPGSMHEIIYLQQILNAINGVADGQFGSMPVYVYLQLIRDAFSGATGTKIGSMDNGTYLEEIGAVAHSAVVPPVVPLVYLLRDQFTTADPAPLVSPRTCEPGPDTIVVTDVANKLSISGGKLVRTGGTVKLLSGSAFLRAAGLAFHIRGNETTNANYGIFGATEGGTNATDGVLVRAGGATGAYDDGVLISQVGNLAGYLNCIYDFLIVKRSVGAFVFMRAGRYGKWFLAWPGITSNGASDKWLYKNGTATDTGTLDEAEVIQVGGVFASDYGFATYYTATPTNPTSCIALRDSVVEFTWTPAANETLEIYLRQVDASNRFIIRCAQAGSTIKLFSVVANTETQLQSAAQTWTVGTPIRIVARCLLDRLMVYTADIKLTQSNLTNEFGTTFGVAGFATGANFAVYPQLATNLPAPFDFSGFRWFLGYGDSKTRDNSYQSLLCDKIETGSGQRWCYETIGRAGYTVAQMAALITQDLATMTQTPEYVLFNMGVNDTTALPAEATWKANLMTICNAIHAKWPATQIYLMRVWKRGELADCNSIATWINDQVALNPTFMHNGPDERIFLENGDDGATYTSDGTHPTDPAGYDLTADQWKTTLGL